jgi:hypothetical protein
VAAWERKRLFDVRKARQQYGLLHLAGDVHVRHGVLRAWRPLFVGGRRLQQK